MFSEWRASECVSKPGQPILNPSHKRITFCLKGMFLHFLICSPQNALRCLVFSAFFIRIGAPGGPSPGPRLGRSGGSSAGFLGKSSDSFPSHVAGAAQFRSLLAGCAVGGPVISGSQHPNIPWDGFLSHRATSSFPSISTDDFFPMK